MTALIIRHFNPTKTDFEFCESRIRRGVPKADASMTNENINTIIIGFVSDVIEKVN